MNVEFLMAARDRIVYAGQKTVVGALLDKPDDDGLVTAVETAQLKLRGKADRPALDAIEIYIAEMVDQGQTLPITNPEGYGAARWLSQGDLATLPDPIPRAYVLYLAKAWQEAKKFPTLTAALNEILTTRTFA